MTHPRDRMKKNFSMFSGDANHLFELNFIRILYESINVFFLQNVKPTIFVIGNMQTNILIRPSGAWVNIRFVLVFP